mmetsp:Transcript_15081/g.31655  ORF Transcript_15081/g.31655 Transcript_15081/m.31655 type:complete len:341 (-) Transcript_15081:114-1136(-)
MDFWMSRTLAPDFLIFFAQVENVFSFVAEDAIHGGIIRHDDVVVHVRFGCRQAELNQSDLGVVDLTRPPRRLGSPLVEHQALHQFSVVHRAPQLLHHANVAQVHVGRLLDLVHIAAEHRQHGIHRDGRQHVLVLTHHLGAQARLDRPHQALPLAQLHGLAHPAPQNPHALLAGAVETPGDGAGVDALGEQVEARVQQGARQDDHGGGAVSGFDVLRLGALHEHLGGGVEDVQLGQQRGAVVGDEDFAGGELEEFVHAAGAEGRADGGGDGLGGHDVGNANVLPFRTLLKRFSARRTGHGRWHGRWHGGCGGHDDAVCCVIILLWTVVVGDFFVSRRLPRK